VRSSDDAALAPAARLGPYTLVSPLAVGTTADVWLAKITGQQGFVKEIALKVLRPEAACRPELVRAFTSEAAIAARLYHPHIVQLFDCGQVGARTYIAMELVDGLTLAQMTARLRGMRARLPTRLLLQVALQICGALHYAHELTEDGIRVGLLHRDLTPDNLMVTALGTAKVIDFGAARLGSAAVPPPALGGQTAYLPPERLLGLPEDRRSDIYMLGVVLYEQATGQRPFDRGEGSVMVRIVEGRPPDPAALVEELPPDLTRIILRAMAREPADRYPSAELMANDLQRVIHQHHARTRRENSQSLDLTLQRVFADEAERFAPDLEAANEGTTRPIVPPWTRPPERQAGRDPEAARCFDRGLAHLASKEYDLALRKWEEACALDQGNRTYQSNLRRLRTRLREDGSKA
jgi:serine/threonine protein kinase